MRKLLSLIVLVFVAVLAIAQFGPSALLSNEPTQQDSRPAPEFSEISAWLNSPPLTVESLRGKVVLVQFWTYSCINCLRTLPYVTKWHEQYKDKGLVVVGVHTPEFAFEKERANVETAVKRLGIHYPVAQDNQYRTWRAFGNQYWPAAYLIDRSGTIVATQFGEGGYQQMENAIARLVGEAMPTAQATDPDLSAVATPELYFGSEKNDGAIVEAQDATRGERAYTLPDNVPPNRFALSGLWNVTGDRATSSADGDEILLRFNARKVNLVAGSVSPQTLSVTVDGTPQPPVTVDGSRLYPLYAGPGGEHVLRLKAPKPGLSAYTFTFG
ncbi:thioredoxin family protein [Bradyrhizobium murdochi]|uniref:thioredoxin family protein n=1 Tax=Bradyrhizobium murdochi TaxID=1038859 RepID=UPI00040E1E7E|nr:thioredoxin family protein [Bradyrhizobium murdochi]